MSALLGEKLILGDVAAATSLYKSYGFTKDKSGDGPFHFLARGATKIHQNWPLPNFITLADFLLENGEDINAVNENGNTPFHEAIGGCAPDLVYWLIAHGAVIQLNKKGISPFQLADDSIKKTRYKEQKDFFKRADGTMVLVARSGLLEIPTPTKFHCPDRFSLRTGLMMAMLASLIYKGDGNDLDDEFSVGNAQVRAMMARWGLKSVRVVEKGDARAMIAQRPASEDMPRLFVVAFRGTKTKKDILADVTAVKAAGGKHSGFKNHLRKIQELLINELSPQDPAPIYITGHSLGGAMATLFTKKLHKRGFSPKQLIMYTFGQPRAGTQEFQKDFDATFDNAYIVQRYLDPVPLVPTYSGYIVGGYTHSGSLRYIDSTGQLYNDVHYQYEDINRGVMSALPKDASPSLDDLRKIWTGGFQQLIQVSATEEKSTLEDIGYYEKSEGGEGFIPQKQSEQKDTNVVSNMLRGRKTALAAHGMLNYVNDMLRLEARVNQPFSWEEDPDLAISSQAARVTLPQDVYDEVIKGNRYQQEQIKAYQHWVKYYTKLPGAAYTLHESIVCSDILPWITNDSKVLQQISEIEDAILLQHPELKKGFNLPKDLHRKDISPLIEVGMYSIINLLEQIIVTNEGIALSYYRWLYWALPECGISLQLKQDENGAPSFTLQTETDSPYRRGLQSSMLHLARESRGGSLHDIAEALPAIAAADNGLHIAKLSQSIHKMQQQWIKSRQVAKTELINLEFAIIGELIAKFKKVGVRCVGVVGASAVVGTVAGAFAGATTGVVLTGATVGIGMPAAIVAGVIVGTSVGVSTTGAVVAGVGLKKLPGYFKSMKSCLKKFHIHLIGVGDPVTSASHRKALRNYCDHDPSRGRVILYMLNGLYITLTLVKLQMVIPINPHKSYEQSSVRVDSKPFLRSQLEKFFKKILNLVTNWLADVEMGEKSVKGNLKVLEKLTESLQEHADLYYTVFLELGTQLSMPNPTLGLEIYRNQFRLRKSMKLLNQKLGDELRPSEEKSTVSIRVTPAVGNSSTTDLPTGRRRSGWQQAQPVSPAIYKRDRPAPLVPAQRKGLTRSKSH